MKKIVALLLIVICASLVYFYNSKPEQREWSEIPNCQLDQSDCSFMLEDEKVTLSLSPRPIKLNEKVVLELKGLSQAEVVKVDFLGLDMDMGYNRPLLKKENDRFIGWSVLPTCTRKIMNWKVSVLIDKTFKNYGFTTRMKTKS